MDKGYVPNGKMVRNEYNGLVSAIRSTNKAKLFEANFPHVDDMEIVRKIQKNQNAVKSDLGYNL
jgi:hypothetical protein